MGLGLHVTSLVLVDFRSFESRELAFGPAATVLVGPNAAGKTNTVEALQLLTAGSSFRHPAPAELVREGASSGRASAVLEGDGRKLDVALTVAPGRRSYALNGKRVQAQELPQTLMSVLFTPDDLGLVKHGASARRDELDSFGRQSAVGYSNLLAAYTRTIEQRNRLLREEVPDLGLLDAWDESAALGGAALLHARLRLFSRLSQKLTTIYGHISGGEELNCRYVCSLGDEVCEMTREQLVGLLAQRIEAARGDDLRRQQTTVGPHRDDVEFSIDGRPARSFGSQGQQRSVALALKMAEVELATEVTGQAPLLLLDDVMSELDESRRAAVTELAETGVQTVITTTNLGYFSPSLLEAAEVVEYGR